jgi:hypothetical protein
MTVNLVLNCDPAGPTRSASSHETPVPAVLVRLPADQQAEFVALGAAGRGLFGHRRTQSIFDANLPLFDQIYSLGASHRDVAEILHALGITRKDGAPLGIGTVSSALSRARRAAAPRPNRSRAERPHRGPRLAFPTGNANSAADKAIPAPGTSDMVTPLHASSVPDQPGPSAHLADELWSGEARHSPEPAGLFSEPRGQSPSPRAMAGDDDGLPAVRRAGELLNRLRKKDED